MGNTTPGPLGSGANKPTIDSGTTVRTQSKPPGPTGYVPDRDLTIPHWRKLTSGEQSLLRPIFANTIPYTDQIIVNNYRDWGGSDNSITPKYTPHMANSIWSYDFSKVQSDYDKWLFIHEMTHAWQWYHGDNNIECAIILYTRYGTDYDPGSYIYNLDDSQTLTDFNIEQQASIVADYWYVTKNITPKYNKGMRAMLEAYKPYIQQLQSAGPPHQDYIDHRNDWRWQRHM